MYIIVAIILIIIIAQQNTRISNLERIVKSGSKAEDRKPDQAVAAPAPVSAASLNQPIPASAAQIHPVDDDESSGKILGRIGIVALVLGIAFFLKYAFDNNWVGPAGRVLLGLVAGIGLMGIGQWLRSKYLGYSDLLMGGGLAVLYLAIYASYGFYHLVDPMMAFMGMIVVTVVGVVISIMNATKTLSILALAFGFLSPFIIGPKNLDQWVTFTYITILNAGILGVLLYKKWTELLVVGLIGTWAYFGWWLDVAYNDSLLIPTLLFLLLQFLIFTAASIIRIIVEKLKATEVDYFILSVTALSFAGVCYWLLMPEYKHYVSIGSVMLAGFYLVVALMAYKENPEDRTLNVFLPGLAVAFLTAAVPIEFSGPWIAAWWFVEALVLYIIASTSSSRGFQIMGVLVYILGLCDLFYYIADYSRPIGYTVFFNGPFIMLLFAVIIAYAIAFMYYRYGSISTEIQQRGIMAFVVMANILTLYALTSQIIIYYQIEGASPNVSNTTVSIFWALYAAFLTIIGFAKRYVAVRRMGLVLFIITAFKVVIDVWSLGELYRIISFIVFGIIALTVSFLYVRFKDRLKEIV